MYIYLYILLLFIYIYFFEGYLKVEMDVCETEYFFLSAFEMNRNANQYFSLGFQDLFGFV